MKIKSKRVSVISAALIICAVNILVLNCKQAQQIEEPRPVDIETLKSRLILQTEEDPESKTKVSKGTFTVFENRKTQKGRMIKLDVVVLHATGADSKPDPIFPLAGGPGADVAKSIMRYEDSWMRRERDIVLVSQRGTGGDNKLECELPANDDNIQGYLDPLFNADAFRACLEELKKNFDLTQYSTCLAADDWNEVRLALGYDKINVIGGSYGTRASLVYMRRHPETVRSTIFNGSRSHRI